MAGYISKNTLHMAKTSGILLLLFISISLSAQINRYVVYFADKEGTPYTTENPSAFLSEKSILRRKDQNIAVDESDLPVNRAYVDGVRSLGADTYYTSKWLNALVIQADQSMITEIEALEYVVNVEYAAPGTKLSHSRVAGNMEQQKTQGLYNQQQLELTGINNLHSEGYHGENVYIAYFDSGFKGVDTLTAFRHIFSEDRYIFGWNMVGNNADVFQYDNHGTQTFSVVAAMVDNGDDTYQGAATLADFMLFITEDDFSEYRIEEYNWLIAAEKADSAGVDIINSSVAYNTFDDPSMDYTYPDLDGETTIISQAASMAADKGLLVVTSAGNEGNEAWHYILTPADAEGVLAVGSIQTDGVKSAFSSVGPTADGRIKPDVASYGNGVRVINDNGDFSSRSGTSFSTPLITGMAALLWGQNPGLSVVELIDLIKSMGSQATNPDNQLGYGNITYGNILGIDDSNNNQAISVFPNPAISDRVQVVGLEVLKKYTLTLFNSQGQAVIKNNQAEVTSRQPYIQLPAQKGLYLILLSSSGATHKIQVVKQ